MATLRKQIALDAGATNVWSAVRDFGQVHTRVAPGFLTKLEIDKGDRVLTFFNGLVARERLVTIDEDQGGPVFASINADSYHPGGVNGLMGDGSVRFFKNSINGPIWRALGSIAGGEVISADSY